MRRRLPEHPTWTLMVTCGGSIVAVRQEYEAEKKHLGWFTVARERDVLATAVEENLQSNPRRSPTDGADKEHDR